MTPQKHPLSWFTERIGRTVYKKHPQTHKDEVVIRTEEYANMFHWEQKLGFSYSDPHPLTASILTCNVLRCDECGKIGTTEDLDKEVAAKGFEGEGWKRLSNGTINCGCK